MENPIYIVELIKSVVSNTGTALGKTYNYMHGHHLEITNILTQLAQDPQGNAGRYPLIALFQDFEEKRKGHFIEVNLNMIIANITEKSYMSDQRYEVNFKPILYPIYTELLHQISRSTFFLQSSVSEIEHTKIDRLFWGRNGLYGNTGNIFNDYIDAIEIKDLKLSVKIKPC